MLARAETDPVHTLSTGGTVKVPPASLLQTFKDRGFLTLEWKFGDGLARELFGDFDTVCQLVEQDYDDRISIIDGSIEHYIQTANDPLANESLIFKNLKREFNSLNMESYQYLEGLFDAIAPGLGNKPVRREVMQFLKKMDNVNLMLKTYTKEYISLAETKLPIRTMFKIWKYHPVKGEKYLTPLHFDRTVFSFVVSTRNPGSECLRIGPVGLGGTIEEVRFQVRNEDLYSPVECDFPLMFPGTCAKRALGLDPTPHAVLNVEPEHLSEARYSLVFFVLPMEGVNPNEIHIADEHELICQETGESFLCRNALPMDAGGLAKVQVRSWRHAYRNWIPAAYLQGLSIEQKVKDWERVIESGTSFTVLAHKKGMQDIAGFINLGPYRDDDPDQDDLQEIRAIYIDPEHWRPESRQVV